MCIKNCHIDKGHQVSQLPKLREFCCECKSNKLVTCCYDSRQVSNMNLYNILSMKTISLKVFMSFIGFWRLFQRVEVSSTMYMFDILTPWHVETLLTHQANRFLLVFGRCQTLRDVVERIERKTRRIRFCVAGHSPITIPHEANDHCDTSRGSSTSFEWSQHVQTTAQWTRQNVSAEHSFVRKIHSSQSQQRRFAAHVCKGVWRTRYVAFTF